MTLFAPILRALGATQPSPEPTPVASPIQGLQNPAAFFAAIRQANLFGGTLSQSEVDGLNAITDAFQGAPVSFAAYALATSYHETAHTMQPVTERGGEAYFTRMYDPEGNRPEIAAALGNCKPGDGPLYCGRGYVQLTGRGNYAKAGRALGCALEAHPEMALQDQTAAQILRRGMDEGWFTGKSFHSFLTSIATRDQFINARRIINGQDCAEMIADYAITFQAALRLGRWT